MADVQKKSGSKLKKILLITLCSILGVIVVAVSTVYGIFFNEANALFSIKKIDNSIYTMEYKNNYFFDEFLEEGASTDAELIDFIVKKVLRGLPIEIGLPNFGCSGFTANTPDGDQLFGRNYDFDHSPILITKTYPKNGYNSIATTDLKSLGFTLDHLPDSLMNKFLLIAAPYVPFDGINEKGVAMSVNMVHGPATAQNTGKISITTTTMIRMVLDKADSVESAIALIEKYDLNDSTGGPFHYQIADKSGDSAIIEYIGDELKITRKTGDYLAMTNFLVYNDGEFNDHYGQDRYDTIINKLNDTGAVLTEQEARELLEAAKIPNPLSPIPSGTMWSNVFNLDKLTMTFSPYQDFSKKIVFRF